MMIINFDTITNNYEVIYVIKTVMKYHLKKIDTSFHQPLPNINIQKTKYWETILWTETKEDTHYVFMRWTETKEDTHYPPGKVVHEGPYQYKHSQE
jgi:hypothetical protein